MSKCNGGIPAQIRIVVRNHDPNGIKARAYDDIHTAESSISSDARPDWPIGDFSRLIRADSASDLLLFAADRPHAKMRKRIAWEDSRAV